jgi:hypothetical protein
MRLAEVASTRVDPPKPPPIHFDTTPEALATNNQLLRDHGFDLGSLIEGSQDTTLGYGSEFRPLDQLEKVHGGHPEFKVLEGFVNNGMGYHFKKEITEAERLNELRGMVERGNHKSAEEESEKASKLLAKDVAHGFSIPISPEIVDEIKGAMVQPLGLATQYTASPKTDHERSNTASPKTSPSPSRKKTCQSTPVSTWRSTRRCVRVMYLPNRPLHREPEAGPP